jgi:transcriptional regulator with XRE-family HTH domain
MGDSTNLAGLIRREQDAGKSLNDIAKASGLSKAKIGQIADPDSRYQVRAETIQKLARGLRLPVSVVQRAALITAGIADPDQVSRGTQVDLIVHTLSGLNDEDLDLVEAMVEAFVRQRERARG